VDEINFRPLESFSILSLLSDALVVGLARRLASCLARLALALLKGAALAPAKGLPARSSANSPSVRTATGAHLSLAHLIRAI